MPSLLEGTPFSRNNFSQLNVLKDTQNENEKPKRLQKIFLGGTLAQEMCKTIQPLLMTKTEITIMGQNKNESLQLQGDFWDAVWQSGNTTRDAKT